MDYTDSHDLNTDMKALERVKAEVAEAAAALQVRVLPIATAVELVTP
jgi:hypothetical protein